MNSWHLQIKAAGYSNLLKLINFPIYLGMPVKYSLMLFVTSNYLKWNTAHCTYMDVWQSPWLKWRDFIMCIKHCFMSYVKFVIFFHLCLRTLTSLSHLCIIHQPRWQIVFYIYPLEIYKGCIGEAAETTNAPVNQTGWQRTIFLVTKRLKEKNLCLILLNLAGQKVLKLFLTPFLCFVNRPEYFLAWKGYQKTVYWTSLILTIHNFNVYW